MDINEAIKLLEEGKIAVAENCELCKGKADGIGVCVPNDKFAKKIGQPDRKQRVAFYPCCSKCTTKLGMKEYMRRIELVMEADVKGRNSGRPVS